MFFSEDYFDDEIRDGFYIPPIMKHCWAAQIEVLKVVEDICDRHGLKYFAMSGTLIGAVRHGGYIPWDDDIDICMLREDYDKFLEYAIEEMPEYYFCKNFMTDNKFREGFTRFVNDKFLRFGNEEFLKKGHGFVCTAGVDIFPFDDIPSDDSKRRELLSKAEVYSSIANYYDSMGLTDELKNLINKIAVRDGLKIDLKDEIGHQFMRETEKLFYGLNETCNAEVSYNYDWLKAAQKGNMNVKFSKKDFEDAIDIPFENTTIRVPKHYDNFIGKQFHDYMKPLRVCDTHNFPWFKDEYRYVKEHFGKKDFSFDASMLPAENRRARWERSLVEKMQEYMSVFEKASAMVEQAFESGDADTGRALMEKCRIITENAAAIENQLKGNGKRRVVFLTWKAKYWNCFDSLYKKEIEEENTEVFVIPVPYFRSDIYGRKGDPIVETEGFPEYVSLTSYESFDFDGIRIDRIYTQNAYDEENEATNLYQAFYSRSLVEITDELIYVPWFELDKYGTDDERAVDVMKFFLFVPGIVRCDSILLREEWLKEHYVRELTKWAGADTEKIWEDKIVIDSCENEISCRKSTDEKKESDSKTLLYYIGTGQLLYGGQKMITKMEENLEVFDKASQALSVMLYVENGLRDIIKKLEPDLLDSFDRVCEKYSMAEGCGLIVADKYIDVSDEKYCEQIVEGADAFYGDAGVLMHMFNRAKKPVMMQNIDIL